MKRVFILFLLLLTFSISNGQDLLQSPKHELAVSYGLITSNQFIDVMKEVFTAVFSFGTYDKANKHYLGSYHLTYKYAPIDQLLIGLTGSIDKSKGDLLDENDVVDGEYSTTYSTAIVSVDYRYLHREMVQLYSGVGAGISVIQDVGRDFATSTKEKGEASTYFNFQINLIGVRVGKALAGFAEFGVGSKGIVNAGISWQF